MLIEDFQISSRIPAQWLPNSNDFLLIGQATLIIAICLFFIAAVVFLLFSWLLSRDLQPNTVGVSIILAAFLFGIASLPRLGYTAVAGVLLIMLLLGALFFITAHYGLSSSSVTAFLLPIILSIILIGTFAGLIVTIVCVLFIWGFAIVESRGLVTPLLPVERSNLTFKAPMFTVLFVGVFFIIGIWIDYLTVGLN